MAAAIDVALLPFRAVWRLVKLLFLPVAFGAASLGLVWLGLGWCLVLAFLCGVWAVCMSWLWWLQTVGELRELGRGTVHVRTTSTGRGKGGRR